MKLAEGVWFPDSEVHLVKMIGLGQRVDGRGSYQYHKLQAALKYVRKHRCAVDVGMHVGLWAMHLAKQFDHVVGFEPVAEHIECLRKNMDGIQNYELHDCALGSHEGSVGLRFLEGSTGSTHIDQSGTGVSLFPLDHFRFEAVDFLKVDVEGYEFFVIEGAEQTIKRHKPVIIIEQKGGKHAFYGKQQYDAKKLLEAWGARQAFEIKGDHCLVWN